MKLKALKRFAFRVTVRTVSTLGDTLYSIVARVRYECGLRLVFEPRYDDIYIVSYPKAGTTVMQMVLYQMTTEGSMDIGHIDEVIPCFEQHLIRNPFRLQHWPSPRIFKTHLPLAFIPTKGKAIYLVRNPKDSCVSYFYHRTSLHGEEQPLSTFVAMFTRGTIGHFRRISSWFKHLELSLPHCGNENVLVLNYKEISENLPTVTEKVASFCKIQMSESKRLQVLQRCQIDFMRNYDSKFDPRLTDTRRSSKTFIRQGGNGTWTDDLSPRMVAMIDARLAKTLRRLRLSPALQINDLDFLKGGVDSTKGVVRQQIETGQGDCFITLSDIGLPVAIFLSFRGVKPASLDALRNRKLRRKVEEGIAARVSTMSGLAIGDYVKVQLTLTNSGAQFIDLTRVLWIGVYRGRVGIVFWLHISDDRSHNALAKMCSDCEPTLLVHDPLSLAQFRNVTQKAAANAQPRLVSGN